MANDRLQDILLRLSRSGWLSGEQLASGVSRMAVSKAVSQLAEAGYPVERKQGQGYRLASSFDVIDGDALQAQLAVPVFASAISTSTNDEAGRWLQEQLASRVAGRSAALFCSGFQKAGRGRLQRKWQARPCDAILASLVWCFQRPPADLPAVSLLVGLSVIETLVALGLAPDELGLKWPNDVLYQGRKLAGILVEATVHQESVSLVIGLGLNMHGAPVNDLRYPAAFVGESSAILSSQTVLAEWASRLMLMLREFNESGFEPFCQRYLQWDVVSGKTLQLEGREVCIDSIDKSGALVVAHDGVTKRYVTGEVSLPWPSC